jgi:hypothetical protein
MYFVSSVSDLLQEDYRRVKEALFFPQMPFGHSALLDPSKSLFGKITALFSTSLTPRNKSTKFFGYFAEKYPCFTGTSNLTVNG